MAHLEVEPKKSTPWLWIVVGLVVLALLFFLLKGCGDTNTEGTTADTTTNATPANGDAENAVTATQPDWSKVDMNAPETTDADITDRDISVRGNDEYTIYSLGEDILFATDQTTLQSNAESKLKQISAALSKRFSDASVGVYGSTDNTGDASHNKQLGADRANAVKDWLVKNGVAADKLSVQSLGETEPVATNNTATGRQQNGMYQL